MTKSNYIKINNQLIAEDSEFKLNSNELYLYSILEMSKDRNDEFYTNLNILNEKTKIKMGSSKQRATKKIKETLFSLVEKKIITITNSDGEIIDDMKPNDVVIIRFSTIEEKGHTQIDMKVFNFIDSVENLHIYTATHRWKNSGDGSFTCSYDRWANILQCTKRHAIDLVNKAVEKGIIYKNIGDYKKDESKKQDTNQYKTTRFEQEEKTIHTKKADKEKVNKLIDKINKKEEQVSPLANIELCTDLEHFDIDDLEDSYYRWSQFKDENGNNTFPELDDYVILLDIENDKKARPLTELEKEVYNAGAKRIAILQKNRVSNEIMEKHMTSAKERIENRNIKVIYEEASTIDFAGDWFGED